MKIFLVNPRFPLSLWDFSYCRDITGNAFPFPPLSLATLAALTPREHEVVICDENVHPVSLDADADIVGITGYSTQKNRVYQLADEFRKKGRMVVIGGPLVERSNIGECARHADVVFLGEAEYTWPAFIRDIQSKAVRPVYAQGELVDMSDSPAPRFDLLEFWAYSSAIIETSRGCPYSCEFCEIPVRLGKGSRTKSLEQVMTEIRGLYALGVDSIFIIDDNFLGNRSRAVILITQIQDFVRSIDYQLSFSCQFTIDIAKDGEILSLLREANFKRVFIGVETPRQSTLTMTKKRQNTQINLLDAVHRVQSHNIIVWGAFIVGFDNDDTGIFKEQLEFIQASSIPIAMVGILQALPGTPLHERVRREGRLKDDEAGGIRGSVNLLTSTNIKPMHMTDEDIASGFRYLVTSLYNYDNFAERMIHAVKLGKNYRIKGRTQIRKKGLLVLHRLLRYYLLTTDLRRIFMFLQVITQTIIHNPQYLETVLMHLIVYKHLKLFYEEGTSAIPPLPISI
jgi:radical SAM superfamily enzyme YgiQ (UPF0313 family)